MTASIFYISSKLFWSKYRLLGDFPNLLTDCTKALDMGPRNGGGAKRPYFFFMQPGKKSSSKEQIKSKDKRMAATTTM